MMGDSPLLYRDRLGLFQAGSYYSMRMLPFATIRRSVAQAAALFVRSVLGSGFLPLTPELSEVVSVVQRQGWAMLPPILSGGQIDEIQDFLRERELIARDGRRFRSTSPIAGVTMASYSLETTLRCPHVVDAMNHSGVLRVAQAYLGCTPTISGLRIDWSSEHQADDGSDVQAFHRDYDDWRFMKLFVYLSEIDDAHGPHEFVGGSHLSSGRFRAAPYTRAELERDYGASSFVRICGPRGTSFIVDTWGVHKANVPVAGERLLLQIQYSILPVRVFDYRKVAVELPGTYSRYVNRLLIE